MYTYIKLFRNCFSQASERRSWRPSAELKRWFSWQWYWDDSLVEELVRDGRLRRVDGHVTMVA